MLLLMGVFIIEYIFANFLSLLAQIDPGGDPETPIVESIALLVSAGFYLGIKAFKKNNNGKH